jgi:hypothetical protein
MQEVAANPSDHHLLLALLEAESEAVGIGPGPGEDLAERVDGSPWNRLRERPEKTTELVPKDAVEWGHDAPVSWMESAEQDCTGA